VADAHLPWAARFPPESLAYQTFSARANPGDFLDAAHATTLPLHPTQLYESFGELALFLVLVLVVRPRKRFDGQVLATWLLLYAVLRTVVELFRGDVERGVYWGLGAGQWTSFVILAVGAAVWVRARQVRPAPAVELG
jgi:phosphatidylglycerol:prolipoprotein diacylglycerol transferase